MQAFLSHLFLPHQSNNHRPRVLHHYSILLLILGFFLGQFAVTYIKTDYPAVLGSSIDLSTEKLVRLTNQEREKEHLNPLTLNNSLSQAAAMKADYMFANNFWAHNAPDGTTPWSFFKQVGYEYTYAGENLARGFTDSAEVMTAWMNSPTHKENILSPHYEEIGFSVKKGRLLGEDTTLIVEMFGSTHAIPVAKAEENSQKKTQQVLPAQTKESYIVKTTSLINSRVFSSTIALLVLAAFISILFLDMIIIQRKKITRMVGHNIDHIFFFGAVLLIVIFSTKGLIV